MFFWSPKTLKNCWRLTLLNLENGCLNVSLRLTVCILCVRLCLWPKVTCCPLHRNVVWTVECFWLCRVCVHLCLWPTVTCCPLHRNVARSVECFWLCCVYVHAVTRLWNTKDGVCRTSRTQVNLYRNSNCRRDPWPLIVLFARRLICRILPSASAIVTVELLSSQIWLSQKWQPDDAFGLLMIDVSLFWRIILCLRYITLQVLVLMSVIYLFQ